MRESTNQKNSAFSYLSLSFACVKTSELKLNVNSACILPTFGDKDPNNIDV